MKIYKLALLVMFAHMAFAQTSSNDELANLRSALSENSISNFVVLRMADNIETRIGVTPQSLREQDTLTRRYKMQLNNARAKVLVDWVKQTGFSRRKDPPDCRWGLLFIDRNGKEVASIFSDKLGLIGNVDGHNLDFPDKHLLDTIHALVGPDIH